MCVCVCVCVDDVDVRTTPQPEVPVGEEAAGETYWSPDIGEVHLGVVGAGRMVRASRRHVLGGHGGVAGRPTVTE